MAAPPWATPAERAGHHALRLFCGLVFVFLIAPVLVIVPLSFNAEPYFTYPMPGVSTRWYEELLESPAWRLALRNSLVVAVATTALATSLGTLAALGLSRREFPHRAWVMSLVLSPMVVPMVITAVGVYFFYSRIGLSNSLVGLTLSHTALATPLVVITVTATLAGFDQSLTRAAASLGAPPLAVFTRVTLPLIAPGVVSGGLFAFITSFDEVVVALFLAGPEQRTLPRQMWSGIREQLSPAILAVATMMTLLSVLVLATVEYLRRRGASAGPDHR
jgi:putative spermidine/putrescine transport system permease protein